MKKLRMIVASVIILAIVSSAFAFKAKKIGKFCYSSVWCGNCVQSPASLRRVAVGTEFSFKAYYVVNWDGGSCSSSSPCCDPSGFVND